MMKHLLHWANRVRLFYGNLPSWQNPGTRRLLIFRGGLIVALLWLTAGQPGVGAVESARQNAALPLGTGPILSEATSTSITSFDPLWAYVGQPVTVYVEVEGGNWLLRPTGSVIVSAAGTAGCVAILSEPFDFGRRGSCSLTFTTTGLKTVTATYGGDAMFQGSVGSGPYQVNKDDTEPVFTSDSPDPSVVGQSVMVYFWVWTRWDGIPTGDVNVYERYPGGDARCVGTLSDGAGACVLTFAQAGGTTLMAYYGGDDEHSRSWSFPGENHQVNLGSTTTTITTDSPDPSVIGQSVVVYFTVAAAAPAGGTPAGNVTLTGNDTTGCIGALAAGSGSCALTFSAVGAKTLTATYGGQANAYDGSLDTEAHAVVAMASTPTQTSTPTATRTATRTATTTQASTGTRTATRTATTTQASAGTRTATRTATKTQASAGTCTATRTATTTQTGPRWRIWLPIILANAMGNE